ncbi:hypothetical protein [Brachybacterium hainanense]|uniref:Uncharacterized protein n=1 Tax=Brachybacterium hainanense TaxID=1541174 RepID=A0ABV6R7H5_9MICO
MSTIEPPGEGEDPRRPDDDIDAEFARMMEGMSLSEEPLTVEDVLSAPSAVPEPEADAAGAEEEPAPIAVVATSVAAAKALAGAIRLGREARSDGVDIPAGTLVFGSETGAFAAGRLDEASAHDLAAVMSTALQRAGVVLFWRRGDRMTATRYHGGQRGEDVSPALVLGAVDPLVEQLLLGALDLAEIGEGIDPASISRAQAVRWVAFRRKKE